MKTNQEILQKAIQKAIAGGWSDYNSLESLKLISTTANTITLEGWVEYVEEGQIDESKTEITFNYKELIYNHDFAKSLWGYESGMFLDPPVWQQHLKQMVIADDPIKYLGEHTG